MKEYDDLAPGTTKILVDRFVSQMEHRQDLEKKVIANDIFNSRAGLILGFIISLVAILVGGYCTLKGEPIAGSIIGGSPTISLAGVFVHGSRQRRKERIERLKIQDDDKKGLS